MSEVISVNEQTGVVVLTAPDVEAIPGSELGQPNGVATLDSGGHLPEVQLPTSVVSSSASSVKSAAKNPVRALEEYSSEPLVSNTTNCTAAINAALEDVSALNVPIQLLGKVYLTEGGHQLPSYLCMKGTGCYIDANLGSIIKLASGMGGVNVLQSQNWGAKTGYDVGITLENFGINANFKEQAGFGLNAMPQTYLSANFVSGEGIVHVGSTEHFAESGLIWVGKWLIEYTGTTANTFTGCSIVTTGTTGAELLISAWVTPHASQGHGLALQCDVGRFNSLQIHYAQASCLIVQGVPSRIAYENHFLALKAGTSNRFAVEIAEQATDNNFTVPVLGDHHGLGCALIRGSDTAMISPHFVGTYSPMSAMLIVAAQCRISQPFFDTVPFAGIRIDTALRGGVGFIDPQIEGINGNLWNFAATSSQSFMETRGGGTHGTQRGRYSGVIGNEEEPHYKYGIRNGALAALVGGQNLKTLSTAEGGSGLLQVDTVAGFSDWPVSGETVKVGAQTLTRTGKTVALAQTDGETAKSATVIKTTVEHVPASAVFATGGGIILVGGGGSHANLLEVSYTAYNESTHEFTGCSGISEAIAAGAQITQCFLTGCTGGTKNETIASKELVSGPVATMFNAAWFDLDTGEKHVAFSFSSNDGYNFKRGWTRSGDPSYYAKILEIKEGEAEVSVAHGLMSEPTVNLNCTLVSGELPAKTQVQLVPSSANLKVKLREEGKAGKAPAGGLKFSVTAECTPVT
jgi:hypothetical protein